MTWLLAPGARVLAVASLASVLMAGASPARGAGLEGAGVIALVNKQRAANGIPPITTIDQQYASSWCPHETEAAFTQGETGRVSAPDDAWSANSTPYTTAPLHQYIIYDPLATVAGDVATANGTDCMGVGVPELLAPITDATPTFYAFVNERGPHYARTSEVARELPTTPQQQLGEPASERTGPQILLYAFGLGFNPQATTVTLTTYSGTTVPGTKVALEAYGGVLVPPPLKAGTSYVLEITWTGEPEHALEGFEVTTAPPKTSTQTVHFATPPAPALVHRRRHRHK
jgi:hypothetical protein